MPQSGAAGNSSQRMVIVHVVLVVLQALIILKVRNESSGGSTSGARNTPAAAFVVDELAKESSSPETCPTTTSPPVVAEQRLPQQNQVVECDDIREDKRCALESCVHNRQSGEDTSPSVTRSSGSTLELLPDGQDDDAVYLAMGHAVGELNGEDGLLKIPNDLDRVCVDLAPGAHGLAAKTWWQHYPKTFVIAIQEDPYAAHVLSHLGSKYFRASYHGQVPHDLTRKKEEIVEDGIPCDDHGVGKCVVHHLDHWVENEEKRIVLNAALRRGTAEESSSSSPSPSPSDAQFKTFSSPLHKNPEESSKSVPYLSFGDLLPLIPNLRTVSGSAGGDTPQPIHLDTLRITGEDLPVLRTVKEETLQRFLCIAIVDYRVSGRNSTNKLVEDLGFVPISKSLFANKKFKSVFERGDFTCSAGHDPERLRVDSPTKELVVAAVTENESAK